MTRLSLTQTNQIKSIFNRLRLFKAMYLKIGDGESCAELDNIWHETVKSILNVLLKYNELCTGMYV